MLTVTLTQYRAAAYDPERFRSERIYAPERSLLHARCRHYRVAELRPQTILIQCSRTALLINGKFAGNIEDAAGSLPLIDSHSQPFPASRSRASLELSSDRPSCRVKGRRLRATISSAPHWPQARIETGPRQLPPCSESVYVPNI